jgi:hypothetical protein
MATALDMDAHDIDKRLRDWIFTLKKPTVPALPDQHWRNVHPQDLDWHDVAKIGLQCASTRAIDVEVD